MMMYTAPGLNTALVTYRRNGMTEGAKINGAIKLIDILFSKIERIERQDFAGTWEVSDDDSVFISDIDLSDCIAKFKMDYLGDK